MKVLDIQKNYHLQSKTEESIFTFNVNKNNYFFSFLKEFNNLAGSTYLLSIEKDANKKIHNFTDLVRIKAKIQQKNTF